jgi:enoyl-CoA hydratase/carnithine racemase
MVMDDATVVAGAAEPLLVLAVQIVSRDALAEGTVEPTRPPEDSLEATALQLLRRIMVDAESGSTWTPVLCDLRDNPDDPDMRAAVRFQLRKAMRRDQSLAAYVENLVPGTTLPDRSSADTSSRVVGDANIFLGTVSGNRMDTRPRPDR